MDRVESLLSNENGRFSPLWSSQRLPVYAKFPVHPSSGQGQLFHGFLPLNRPREGRIALEYGCSGGAVMLETRMGTKVPRVFLKMQRVPENRAPVNT
jgi:hypothetical protein